MKTYMAKEKDIKRKWYIVDAKDKILGRLATRIAIVLRGKHKAEYTPHIDCGDEVIVINADKIRTTGRKLKQKEYQAYSGYPGGRKTKKLETVLEHKPAQVLRLAIKRMLPGTPLARKMLKKLRVYSGENHPHAAQNPQELKL
ncbi:MAG: 50S ribosomal protein L13 [Candidatus Omnitrophota bacterium]|nr:MAG: 50S ribosomal protein L13 [Candidatus Omnitrophota bacterium]